MVDVTLVNAQAHLTPHTMGDLLMRPSIVLIAMIINMLLMAGIIYINYFAPRPGSITLEQQGAPKPERTIAVVVPSAIRGGTNEIVQSLAQTLEKSFFYSDYQSIQCKCKPYSHAKQHRVCDTCWS